MDRLQKRDEAYQEYWKGLTRKGDPLHIPNKFKSGFDAGWQAAFEAGRVEGREQAAQAVRGSLSLALAGASVTVLSYEEVLQIAEREIRSLPGVK